MRERVLELMGEVEALLLSARLREDASPYAMLLKGECTAILDEVLEDLDRNLPDPETVVQELDFARGALHEHLAASVGSHLIN